MFYVQETDTYLPLGKAFSLRGIQYPSNWLDLASPEEMAAIGIAPVIQSGERPNPLFFDVTESLEGGVNIIHSTRRELPVIKNDLAAKIASRRYEAETAGIIHCGTRISTSRESQAQIINSLANLTRNPSGTINFKGRDAWLTLDLAGMTALADAVDRHVQACFAAERQLLDALAEVSSFEALMTFSPEISPLLAVS